MNRIHFTALTSLALISACTPSSDPVEPEPVVPKMAAEDVALKTLPEIVDALETGAVTSEALTQAFLDRIASTQADYELNALISQNPDALKLAKSIDEARAAGEDLPLLAGVPILLKDNIDTADNMPTTAGSLALAQNYATRDAALAARLKANGAIILGKTNLSEWANFRGARSQSGWSGMAGRAKNPHILDRQTCGSSAGSGAAMAASLAAGTVGTETNGSIICPSNANGIVGFKPTLGVVSQEGIVPISFSQDTAGPMTKTVEGAAMMLTAMATDGKGTDYVAALSDTSLEGKKLGVLRFSVSDQPGIAESFDAALEVLKAQGAELVEITEFDRGVEGYGDKSTSVLLHEFKTTLNEYLAGTPDSVSARTLTDLIAFNEAEADRELSVFGQELFYEADATAGIEDEGYKAALAEIKLATGKNGIDRLMSEYGVDMLVAPSGPLVPVVNETGPDNWPAWSGAGYLAAVAGYPHLTVPMGAVDHVPLGISFMSTAGDDATVLSFGYDFEQASHLRVEPTFIASSLGAPAQ